jgi:hypothetical protein
MFLYLVHLQQINQKTLRRLIMKIKASDTLIPFKRERTAVVFILGLLYYVSSQLIKVV